MVFMGTTTFPYCLVFGLFDALFFCVFGVLVVEGGGAWRCCEHNEMAATGGSLHPDAHVRLQVRVAEKFSRTPTI